MVMTCFAACQLSFSFCKQKSEKRNYDFLDDGQVCQFSAEDISEEISEVWLNSPQTSE